MTLSDSAGNLAGDLADIDSRRVADIQRHRARSSSRHSELHELSQRSWALCDGRYASLQQHNTNVRIARLLTIAASVIDETGDTSPQSQAALAAAKQAFDTASADEALFPIDGRLRPWEMPAVEYILV